MTPLQFEEHHQQEWLELQILLSQLHKNLRGQSADGRPIAGEHVAALYRRACEQLALARARAYPAYLVDRLEQLTADGHQLIYQRSEFGYSRLKHLIAYEFPCAVRAHSSYVWLALAVFAIPTLVLGWVVYFRPELILAVVDSHTAKTFEEMYSQNAAAIGRDRGADTDWEMFGYYIANNIGVSFQCFASGLFAGIGSLFYLAFNGAYGGAIGGYLTQRGLSETFYSFVVTHSAFELTAIVLSGAAGLRLGHALLVPGRYTRLQSLVRATHESAIIIYGVVIFLIIAAAIEAFWSSAQWIPPFMKYSVAALVWTAVLSYLTLQGRSAR
jgi:uncharacterized membrane protein SpoIIM required for sporulation